MDVSPHAASSKVTVECTDPSGLFSTISPIISEVLPLRNLHWKSPTRPLRSIDSLHVELVPAQHTSEEQRRTSDGGTGAVAHRRHQIPGLRQTPYLKVFLLRCDDNETYKSVARKQVREWIKTHASPAPTTGAVPSSSQENHDAFEWLIIHVVPDGDGTEKKESTSKWVGRGSTSILEKLRADFNGSSKTAVDRVVQLKLPKSEGVPRSPILGGQLEDLVEKLKYGILTSFDLRVRQYEEDIREKDSQRSLPGWNFCTFFILKEGLARGFENVGLFDDALIGYDELAVGFDSAIRDQLAGVGDQHGGTFLDFSKDWRKKLEDALGEDKEKGSDDSDDSEEEDEADEEDRNSVENTDSSASLKLDAEHFPLDAQKKPYRDMILANDISVFDFRVYLFSRQLMLLLKAAGAPWLRKMDSTPESGAGRKVNPVEDLTLLAEICERSTEFVSLGARTLRNDLEVGLSQGDYGSYEETVKTKTIENLVTSWTYATACQILEQTATESIILPLSSLRQVRNSTDASSVAAAVAETRPDVPKRSSSLLTAPVVKQRPTSQEILSPDSYLDLHGRAPAGQKKAVSNAEKTGAEELSSGRGELYVLARRTLTELGRRQGWSNDWKNLDLLYDDADSDSAMEDISLDDDDKKPDAEAQTQRNITAGIIIPILIYAMRSKANFQSVYEELTDQIFRHYTGASRSKSAEMAMADIALIKYRAGDYASASLHFQQMSEFYNECDWSSLEGSMLELYSRCLERLGRKDEYMRVLIKLLGKYAGNTRSGKIPSTASGKRASTITPLSVSKSRSVVAKYVKDLLEASRSLTKEVSVPLKDFFDDVRVNPTVFHHENRDGFKFQLTLHSLLGHEIKIDSMKIRLVHSVETQNSEIWLERTDEAVVKSSPTKLWLESNTSVHGKYLVDRIEIRAANVLFVQGNATLTLLPPGFREGAEETTEDEQRPHVFCYSPARGLVARVTAPRLIDLDRLRSIEVELESGWNNITHGVLRIRPATAGLRLQVADTSVVEGDMNVRGNLDSGNIEFENFAPDSFARFRIPYSMEETHNSLSAKVEVTYETEQGRFTFLSSTSIISTLPVSVNVQDVFKDEVLFSRFTVGPAMLIPLRVLGCHIPKSKAFDVESCMSEQMVMDVFPKQPASLVYKIVPRPDAPITLSKKERSLALTVDFKCLDEECLSVIEAEFKKDLEATAFHSRSRLLVPHLMHAFRTQWTSNNMEVIGLLREVEILPYEKVRWETVTAALGKDLQNQLQEWLMNWHKDHPVLPLPDDAPSVPRRQIVVPVDVPEIQVVHTAELRVSNLSGTHPHAAVGQMLATELRLRHTRRWCPEERQEDDESLEFSYEIHANPELWLVGGRRRGNFTAKAGEECLFAVMLLPQRPGHLLLPGVEIKTFANAATPPLGSTTAGGSGGGSAAGQRRQIPCEIDYRNHGETMLVLPDLRKTTVSIEAAGSQGGGSWLVDSDRRVEVEPFGQA